MKHKDNLADATKAIQVLLQAQPKWLISRLRGKAWVRNSYENVRNKNSVIVGSNISWFIKDGVMKAYDLVTGRMLRDDQVLFHRPVELLLCGELDGEDTDYPVKTDKTDKGTTEEVLQKIYSHCKPMFKMHEEWGFQGLLKIDKGKYIIRCGERQ
jgi:hypothetical protein